jgi:hypothetical protein
VGSIKTAAPLVEFKRWRISVNISLDALGTINSKKTSASKFDEI